MIAEDARRADRAGARGTDAVEARGSRQLSQEEKAARATYVVHNDGSLSDLDRELRALWPELTRAARSAA